MNCFIYCLSNLLNCQATTVIESIGHTGLEMVGSPPAKRGIHLCEVLNYLLDRNIYGVLLLRKLDNDDGAVLSTNYTDEHWSLRCKKIILTMHNYNVPHALPMDTAGRVYCSVLHRYLTPAEIEEQRSHHYGLILFMT